ELVAAAPVRIEATVPARVRANGSAGGTVVARVVDRFDNAVASNKLAARARGRVGAFASRPDGTAAASYVAPRTREPGDDDVELAGYTTTFDVQAMSLAESVTGKVSVLPVLARVAYRGSLGHGLIDAWLGGGAGVAFAATSLSSPSSGTERGSATRFAATGFA